MELLIPVLVFAGFSLFAWESGYREGVRRGSDRRDNGIDRGRDPGCHGVPDVPAGMVDRLWGGDQTDESAMAGWACGVERQEVWEA